MTACILGGMPSLQPKQSGAALLNLGTSYEAPSLLSLVLCSSTLPLTTGLHLRLNLTQIPELQLRTSYFCWTLALPDPTDSHMCSGKTPLFCPTQRQGGLRPPLTLVQLPHFTDEDTEPEVPGSVTAVSQDRVMDLLYVLNEDFESKGL